MKNVSLLLIFTILIPIISFAQDPWVKIGDMPDIRLFHTVNEINGKVYIIGGASDEATGSIPDSVWIYDRQANSWSAFAHNGVRVGHSSCVVNDKLYIIGGYRTTSFNQSSSSMDMYDPDIGKWSALKNMPTHRGVFACAAIDGKIYTIGGSQNESFSGLKTLEMYNTTDSTWTKLKDMPDGRWGLSAIAVNGKIYVFGGRTTNSSSVYSSVNIYNPETDNWSLSSSNMPTRRYQFTVCILNELLYTIGGWFNSGSGPLYDKVEVFDTIKEEWTTKTPIPVKHALLSSLVYDGKIYVYGGSYKTHPIKGTSAIYEYNPMNDPTGLNESLIDIPNKFTLKQNYPNPFNPSTTIEFSIPKTEFVFLKIYNLLGQEVAILVSDKLTLGNYKYSWDAFGFASGVYFYRLETGKGFIQSRKLILLK